MASYEIPGAGQNHSEVAEATARAVRDAQNLWEYSVNQVVRGFCDKFGLNVLRDNDGGWFLRVRGTKIDLHDGVWFSDEGAPEGWEGSFNSLETLLNSDGPFYRPVYTHIFDYERKG